MKLKPEWRVTLEHVESGKTFRLSLISQPWKGRYWLRFNGKKSEKLPECTKTKLVMEIAKVLQMEKF